MEFITEKKVVGTKQVKRALSNEKAKYVYLAVDCDLHVIKDIISKCEKQDVEYNRIYTMKQLGTACGIDVNAAAVAILKDKDF